MNEGWKVSEHRHVWLATAQRLPHLAGMDQRPPPAWDDSPEPDGEWVVAPGRPYPEKLERRFKIASAVAGVVAGVTVLALWSAFVASPPSGFKSMAEIVAMTLLAAGLIYGTVRAVGLFVVVAVAIRPGRRHYSLEWRGSPSTKGRNWEQIGGFVWAGLLVAALVILSR